MKQRLANVFQGVETRRKVSFAFLETKPQGKRYESHFPRKQTNEQALFDVFTG